MKPVQTIRTCKAEFNKQKEEAGEARDMTAAALYSRNPLKVCYNSWQISSSLKDAPTPATFSSFPTLVRFFAIVLCGLILSQVSRLSGIWRTGVGGLGWWLQTACLVDWLLFLGRCAITFSPTYLPWQFSVGSTYYESMWYESMKRRLCGCTSDLTNVGAVVVQLRFCKLNSPPICSGAKMCSSFLTTLRKQFEIGSFPCSEAHHELDGWKSQSRYFKFCISLYKVCVSSLVECLLQVYSSLSQSLSSSTVDVASVRNRISEGPPRFLFHRPKHRSQLMRWISGLEWVDSSLVSQDRNEIKYQRQRLNI